MQTDKDENATKFENTIEKPEIRNIISLARSPRFFLGAILVYSSVGVFYFNHIGIPIDIFLAEYGYIALAVLLFTIGIYLFLDELKKVQISRDLRFVDVDERSRNQRMEKIDLADVQKKEEVADRGNGGTRGAPHEISQLKVDALGNSTGILTFVIYFNSIRSLLEEKASIADEKASILLDKGTAYAKFGISFFIFCVIGWQLVAYFSGFQPQYIYGIISTSLLFIFIEFLSAWFLKQYRQFIDTSTYLIKVKSIFDRYMLVYLASQEAIANDHDTKKSNQLLLDLLKSEISWPETYLTKSPDLSFAKEALETMTQMVKSLRSDSKNAGSKDSPNSTQNI